VEEREGVVVGLIIEQRRLKRMSDNSYPLGFEYHLCTPSSSS